MRQRRPTSYAAIADALGVEHCRGITKSGFYCTSKADHFNGGITGSTIHWADRRVQWPGLVRFMKLVVVAKDPSIEDEVPWRRVYRLNQGIRELSPLIKTRIPVRYLESDRAFVRASVARLPNSERLRKQAFDWSRREAGRTY